MTTKRIVLATLIVAVTIGGIVEVTRPCCAPRLPPGSQTPAPVPTLWWSEPVTPGVSIPVTSIPPVEVE